MLKIAIVLLLIGVSLCCGCVANAPQPAVHVTPTADVTPNFNVDQTLSVQSTGEIFARTPVGTPIPKGVNNE